MALEAERGVDRRTLYTKTLIKSSLLELMETHSFTSISITALSDHAGIGRNTFYRHYSNLFDVITEIIDDSLAEMFAVFRHFNIGQAGNLTSYLVPISEYLRGSKRFRPLYSEETLSDLIISRLILIDDRCFSRHLESTRQLTPQQADALVRFQAAGLLEVLHAYARVPDAQWNDITQALDLVSAGQSTQ